MDEQHRNEAPDTAQETGAETPDAPDGAAPETPPEPKKPVELDAASLDIIRGMVDAQKTEPAETPAAVAPAEETEPEASGPTPEAAPARPSRQSEREARWAELRARFAAEAAEEAAAEEAAAADAAAAAASAAAETGSEASDEMPEDGDAAPAQSPLDRIRAREAARAAELAAAMPAPGADPAEPGRPEADAPGPTTGDGVAYTPFDESAFGPTGTLDEPRPEPAPVAAPEMFAEAETDEEAPARRNFVEQGEAPPPRDWGSIADHEMGSRTKWVWRVAIYGGIVAAPVALFALSPFSPKDTVAHHVTALGCQFGELFDLQNMEEGQPGYHASLDEDGDGIACEKKRAPRISASGGAGFRRP